MKLICGLCALLVAALVGVGHSSPLFIAEGDIKPGVTQSEVKALPDTLVESYYAGQKDSAYEYFQHRSIQKFLAMWVKEETGDIEKPVWNLTSFTKISVLDHDLTVSRADEALYCCTFSDGANRFGYAIVKYNELDPSIENWSITETTPYVYDLQTNEKQISESLQKTDIDLSTATASRIYLFDREKSRADQAILFTDGKGDHYICYFGNAVLQAEKWSKS